MPSPSGDVLLWLQIQPRFGVGRGDGEGEMCVVLPGTAPALQQFFPQATRHSLLGPPPVGVSLKPTRLGFPNLPFQRQNRMFRKVGSKLRTILGFRAPFALRVVDCIVDKEEGERREPYNEFAPCYWQRNGETSPSLRFLLSVFTFRMQRFLVCVCPGQIISHSRTV